MPAGSPMRGQAAVREILSVLSGAATATAAPCCRGGAAQSRGCLGGQQLQLPGEMDAHPAHRGSDHHEQARAGRKNHELRFEPEEEGPRIARRDANDAYRPRDPRSEGGSVSGKGAAECFWIRVHSRDSRAELFVLSLYTNRHSCTSIHTSTGNRRALPSRRRGVTRRLDG